MSRFVSRLNWNLPHDILVISSTLADLSPQGPFPNSTSSVQIAPSTLSREQLTHT